MRTHRGFSVLCRAVVLGLAIASPLSAQVAGVRTGQGDFAAIDSMIEDQLAQACVPGGALVIVRGDQIVHVRGFGTAGPTTPFYLGSTTKSFTALAVLELVEERRVDLDAPVQRYLPWFTLADGAFSRGITVRQLSARALAEMHVSRGNIEPGTDLALGFVIQDVDGIKTLDISGSVPAYLSRFVMLPDSGLGVALLANGNGVAAEGHVMDATLNVARMVMGKPAVPIRFPLMFAVPIAFFLLLPLFQIAGALFAIRRFRRWREMSAIRIALPALGSAALGTLLLVGLPLAFQSYLRIMRLFQPGLGWAITVSGWFALAWALIRMVIAATRVNSRLGACP